MGIAMGVIGGVGALAGAGASMYGASKAGESHYLNPADSARHWLDAFTRQSGGLYDLENALRPGYGALDRQQAYEALFGSPERAKWKNVLRLNDNNRWYTAKVRVREPGAPGIISMAEAAQLPMEQMYYGAAQRGQDFAGMSMARGMGMGEFLDPEGTGLRNDLASSARSQLAMGTQLDPAQAREIQQAARQGQAARGMGMGPSDLYEELMSMGSAGQNRLQQRQDMALRAMQAQPDMRLMAMQQFMTPSPATGLGLGIMGTGFNVANTAGPKLGMDPWRTPGEQNINNAGANAAMAAGGGLMGLGGQLIGQYIRNQGPQPVQGYNDQTYYPRGGGSYYSASPY